MYLEETFMNLKLKKDGKDLKVISSHGTPTVVFSNWFESPDNQHLGIRTIDGITLRINSNTLKLEPYEVSKDPTECRCTHVGCNAVVTYNLNSHPWHNVLRFVLKSSHCSYKIYGNKFNNYLDPGAGNGFNYQHLEGRNGSDTYVLNHGYGEFNEINNYADDSKTDTLRLGLEFDDICVYFHGRNDVILASNSRPDSLSVLILNYFLGAKYQHLQVISVDKVVFNISKQYPYKKVIAVDRRIIDSPQNIDPQRNSVIASALDLKGSLTSANNMTGTDTTREMEGGAEADILRGGQEGTVFEGKHGNDTIYGGAGNDIVFCGYGHDVIYGGAGDDYVYGGEGSDITRGGNGSDTLSFKGDGFLHKGVTVDLNIGFGKGADAEGDIYESIENVYGTIHNDVLIGSDSGNELHCLEGDDTLSPHGGNDKLVGGEGKDLYLLYNAWGLKIIDNFANDQTEDTLSLAHLNSADACVFLLGDDLYIQIDKSTLASVLFHGRRLTVIIKNWNVSAKYSHLKVLFNDTLWEGYALSGISPVLEKLENNVYFIKTRTNLEVVSANQTSVTLSWNQPSGLLTSSESELYLVHFKQLEPTSLKKTQLQSQASITVSYLDPTAHYVFAVALSKCNATIATIPQGGRVCSDGKWIGYVDDTCEPIARLVNVGERWSTISGLLQLWQNGGWTFASSTPTQQTLILSCRSVGIESPYYVKHDSMSSKIFVTCSKLRFTQPKPTVYEGRVEMLNQGFWEGLCVTERGTQVGSKRICEALGFNFRSAVVSISTGWTDHWFDCKKQS